MAKLLDIVLDIDFESVCRLCLKQNGVMSSIYDDTRSTLSERILSIASVQILPDDGLPGLICHCCRNKVEKFVKFREQIEKSYYLLCHCIGIDIADTDSICEENQIPLLSKSTVSLIKECFSNEKLSSTSKVKDINHDNNHGQSVDVDNLQYFIRKHYFEDTDSSADLLVNPADGYINVDHLTYNITEDDKVIYEKNSDNCLLVSNEDISDEQINLIPIDINSITSSNINNTEENEVLLDYCTLKEQEIKPSNDSKIFSLSFSDSKPIHNESLRDVFHSLENEDEETYQSEFDDITKYLKTSKNIDFHKLKEEIKYLKSKNEKNERTTETKADHLAKKLANRGVLCVKTEIVSDNSSAENKTITFNNEKCKNEDVQTRNIKLSNGIHVKTVEANDILYKVGDKKIKQILLSAGDIWETRFAEKQIESREIFTETNLQKEILPRITEILTTFIEQKKSHERADETEQQLLTLTKYMCHLCLVEFEESNLDLLKKHSESHFYWGPNRVIGKLQNGPPFKCEVCGKNMNQRYDFIIHQRDHFNIKPFICNICNRTFPSTTKLKLHSTRHAPSRNTAEGYAHACSLCNKTFIKKQELYYHMRTHSASSSSPLVCKICHKIFSNPATLKMHNRRHVEGTRHCCEICGKSYFNKTELSRHIQFHSGIRQFPCHLCEKAFCSNAERRRHLLYHFKNKKFKCSECDKSFYESGHLNIHMRSHTNFRPHICEICGKGFPTNIKVMRHLKMHERCSPSPADVRDKLLMRKQITNSNVKPLKNTVYPKYTAVNTENVIMTTDPSQPVNNADNNQLITLEPREFSNTINLQQLQEDNDDEEESYIIIHEGGDTDGEVSMHNMPSCSDTQMLAGENGQLFYILDDEELAALGQAIENPKLSL